MTCPLVLEMMQCAAQNRKFAGSEDKVQQALVDLRKFRNGEGFIDPTSAATSTSKLASGV